MIPAIRRAFLALLCVILFLDGVYLTFQGLGSLLWAWPSPHLGSWSLVGVGGVLLFLGMTPKAVRLIWPFLK